MSTALLLCPSAMMTGGEGGGFFPGMPSSPSAGSRIRLGAGGDGGSPLPTLRHPSAHPCGGPHLLMPSRGGERVLKTMAEGQRRGGWPDGVPSPLL